ncbi:MAG: helix-turn-helix transcriptional regulator [Solirubrobacterales bacterium]|nr:helix-turn-helix transcriptional regulator [Solirubrobacterales bacterium]
MTGYPFSEAWPGAGRGGPGSGRRHHHHHDHRSEGKALARELARQWAFARGVPGGRGRGPSPEEIENLRELRRMAGAAFGGGPFGRGPRGRGRGRRRRGDVRLALLRLLGEEPRNGYQLMQTIEERSGGNWRPSPGSVYPTLAQLEDEGLIRSTEADGARRFQITDAGRGHLESRADEPDPWQSDDAEGEHALAELGPAIVGLGKAAWQVASEGDADQRARASEILAAARRDLYRILTEEPRAGEAEPDADGDNETSEV